MKMHCTIIFHYFIHVKKKRNYSSLYLTLKIPLQAVYVYNFTFEITLQAVQKTFHNLLLLLSIFDLVGEHCQGHDYAHDHEQLTMTITIIMNNWPLPWPWTIDHDRCTLWQQFPSSLYPSSAHQRQWSIFSLWFFPMSCPLRTLAW